jgi:hypothetical protein
VAQGEKSRDVRISSPCHFITALLIFTAVSSAAAETKRLRQQCIDDCRIETTTCTTRCKTEDCLNACTEPLGSCINKCREMYPRTQ